MVLLCLLTPDQWCPAVRYGVFEVSRPAEAKLPNFLGRKASGFVPGHLLWLERDLISGRRSLTALFQANDNKGSDPPKVHQYRRWALPGQREGRFLPPSRPVPSARAERR